MADEKHSGLNGQRVYLAATAGQRENGGANTQFKPKVSRAIYQITETP